MSIKNKLVTAVTTAGLLAGLFGSAFVPAASGAGRVDPTLVPVAGRTVYSHGALLAGVDTLGATTPSTETTLGTTAANQPNKAASKSLYWSQVAAYGGFDAVATKTDTAFIGVTLQDSTGTAIATQMDLKATVSNTLVGVAWGYAADETAVACSALGSNTLFDQSDEVEGVSGDAGLYKLCIITEGATKVGTSTITITANGVTMPAVTVTTLGDLTSLELSAASGYKRVAYGNDIVAKFWKVVGKDKAGNILNAGDTSWGGTLDAFNITEDSLVPEHTSGLDTSWTYIDEAVGAQDGTTAGLGLRAYNRYSLSASVCNTESFTGAGDGDEGKTFDLAIEATNAASDVVTSNAVAITCTRDETFAKVSKIEASATSGATDYEDADGVTSWTVSAYMVDAETGTPIGVGADFIGGTTDLVITNPTVLTNAVWTENESATSFTGTDGKISLGTMDPGAGFVAKKHEYTVKVAHTNFFNEGNGADPVALTQKLYFDASVDFEQIVPTVTRNKAKTSATVTVDCGYGDSLASVVFEITKANGDTVNRSRRANVNGVVKIVLSARNTTWDVLAACVAGGDSEVATVTFR